jgi:hypothetical protein
MAEYWILLDGVNNMYGKKWLFISVRGLYFGKKLKDSG